MGAPSKGIKLRYSSPNREGIHSKASNHSSPPPHPTPPTVSRRNARLSTSRTGRLANRSLLPAIEKCILRAVVSPGMDGDGKGGSISEIRIDSNQYPCGFVAVAETGMQGSLNRRRKWGKFCNSVDSRGVLWVRRVCFSLVG